MTEVFQTLLNLEIAKLQYEYAKISDQQDLGNITSAEAQKERYPIMMKIDFGIHLKELIADYLEEN